MAAQIIPTDATPGAREAQGDQFIDRALTTFEKDAQADYTKGLGELSSADQTVVSRRATSFAALPSDQQIQVLTAMEKTPFFNLVRTHTDHGLLRRARYTAATTTRPAGSW